MSSIKQIIANRANALKITGPGPAGRPISAANSTKHGLFAKRLLIREEDRAPFEEFSQQIYAEFQPQGATETYYVEHLIDQCWRLRDCLKIETDLFEWYRVYQEVEGDVGIAFAHDASQTNSLTRLSRYAPIFQRGLLKDLAELRKLQARLCRPSTLAQDPVEPAGSGAGHDLQAHNSAIPQLATATTQSSPPLPAQPAPVAETYSAPLGILAQQVLLSDEDPTQFDDYLQALFAEWQPRRATKAFVVELFAVSSWRLCRLSRVEVGLFEQYRFDKNLDGGPLAAFVQDATEMDCYSKLAVCETRLQNSLSKILKELLA